ncbi:MAG: cyclic lactone autoinducer peptide [Lachnospiraceae bacterium]|nr:cyclic lactone autoinducer peptide [Lachnospiraceae bacterium]
MKKVNRKVLKLIERATRNEVVRSRDPFPPFCSGIWHQPKRPAKK